MLSFIISFIKSCEYTLDSTSGPYLYTRRLKSNECVSISVLNRTYFHLVSSDNLAIERFTIEGDNVYNMCYKGLIRDNFQVDFVEDPPVQYIFTAINDTNFNIAYGSIEKFECKKVILDNRNPWIIEERKSEINDNICYLMGSFGIQEVEIEMTNCLNCPEIYVYDTVDMNGLVVSKLDKEGKINGKAQNAKKPLLVIVKPNKDNVKEIILYYIKINLDMIYQLF